MTSAVVFNSLTDTLWIKTTTAVLLLPGEVNPAGADLHHGSGHPGMRLMDECLVHILSMGSKALMLQVWANLSTGSLTFRWFCCGVKNVLNVETLHTVENKDHLLSFRMCTDPNDEIKAGLLAQADSSDKLLRSTQWQHISITYTQQPEGKKNVHGRVVVWVCGLRWEDASVSRQGY